MTVVIYHKHVGGVSRYRSWLQLNVLECGQAWVKGTALRHSAPRRA